MNPERDVFVGLLGRQGHELARDEHPVVVVEDPIEHHDPVEEQLCPGLLGEEEACVFVCHVYEHRTAPARIATDPAQSSAAISSTDRR